MSRIVVMDFLEIVTHTAYLLLNIGAPVEARVFTKQAYELAQKNSLRRGYVLTCSDWLPAYRSEVKIL